MTNEKIGRQIATFSIELIRQGIASWSFKREVLFLRWPQKNTKYCPYIMYFVYSTIDIKCLWFNISYLTMPPPLKERRWLSCEGKPWGKEAIILASPPTGMSGGGLLLKMTIYKIWIVNIASYPLGRVFLNWLQTVRSQVEHESKNESPQVGLLCEGL